MNASSILEVPVPGRLSPFLAAAVLLAGCAPAQPDPESTGSATAEVTQQTTTTPAATTSGSPAPEAAGAGPGLEQRFTTPDGGVSFGHPAGWEVIHEESSRDRDLTIDRWEVIDEQGEPVLGLTIRTWYPPAGPPPVESVLPQGEVPGMLDGLGNPVQAVVAATPGHDGSSTSIIYGLAAGTGADTTIFDLRWGNNHLLSFSGGQERGPYEDVNLAAEAQEFAASPRFRQEILPVLQSLTVGEPPAVGTGPEEDVPEETGGSRPSGAGEAVEGMTPGDIDRWAEELEEGYLAELGYWEFTDAPPGTAPASIITFTATTYGELQVLVPVWTTEDEADAIVTHVATIVADLPEAPSVVSVHPGGDQPALATQSITW